MSTTMEQLVQDGREPVPQRQVHVSAEPQRRPWLVSGVRSDIFERVPTQVTPDVGGRGALLGLGEMLSRT